MMEIYKRTETAETAREEVCEEEKEDEDEEVDPEMTVPWH